MQIRKNTESEFGLFRYAVLFSELEERLLALQEKYSENMRIDVIGHSNEQKEIFLVTLAKDVSDEAIDAFMKKRKKQVWEPKDALNNLDKDNFGPIPIAINCNIHGSEISGTDGMLTFIDEVLGGDKKEQYLDDCVMLITICLNPDGRGRGLDILNGNAVDMNRDFMAQTQPEVRALVSGVITKFFPLILADMHGFVSSGNILIDACTPPHNPFMEYDLYQASLIGDAQSMAEVIKKRLGLDTDIPVLLWDQGWEDYSPIYTPGYAMLTGAVGHTIETNFPSVEGADVIHCCGIGILNFIHQNKMQLFENQCNWYLRGLENRPLKHDLHKYEYYVIPNNREEQRDLDSVRQTIDQILFNGIMVCQNEAGDYVIPVRQPLRPLLHNMLWEGEDISDDIEELYDCSFYSYKVMRGIHVDLVKADDERTHDLTEIETAEVPTSKSHSGRTLRISCKTDGSYALVNKLIKKGIAVWQTALPDENIAGSAAGDFLVQDKNARPIINKFIADRHVDIYSGSMPDDKTQLFSPRVLIVSDSGVTDEAMTALGFDCTFVSFSELNRGYQIPPEKFDVFVVGGTQLHLWNDPYDEERGVSYQQSWALRQRGRDEVIRAARAFDKLVLYGFAGNEVNKAIGRIACEEVEIQPSDNGDKEGNAPFYGLQGANGSFRMKLDVTNPLAYGYQENELFYLVQPIPYESAEADIAIWYDEDSFVEGFNKLKGVTDEKIAAFHHKDDNYNTVLFGFDPTYRGYTGLTFRMLANGIFYSFNNR